MSPISHRFSHELMMSAGVGPPEQDFTKRVTWPKMQENL
jgi:hypothetical protein